jgi:dinuclear metal center YbgI/SA1388 family protein
MTTINEVIGFLEELAPTALQEGYDNAGLLVGKKEAKVTGVLVCLDSVEEVVEEAVKIGANLIIAHHPIIFKGLKKLNGANYVERTIISAIRNDIAIYACHTNLDSVHNGVSAHIAQKIGLTNVRVLQPQKGGLQQLVTYVPHSHLEEVRQALFEAGAGNVGQKYDQCSYSSGGVGTFRALLGAEPFVGEVGQMHHETETRLEVVFPTHLHRKVVQKLKQAHPYEEVAFGVISLENENSDIGFGVVGELEKPMDTLEFLHKIKSTMKAGMLRYTSIHQKQIQRVALCGGSGGFLLSAAKRVGADLFLTSDMKYHEFFDAENQIVIADIGHYEAEQYTNELIADYLQQKFSTFAIRISEINTNPVNYL